LKDIPEDTVVQASPRRLEHRGIIALLVWSQNPLVHTDIAVLDFWDAHVVGLLAYKSDQRKQSKMAILAYLLPYFLSHDNGLKLLSKLLPSKIWLFPPDEHRRSLCAHRSKELVNEYITRSAALNTTFLR